MAEHRNGVKFPGEPVAVMAKLFPKGLTQVFNAKTFCHWPVGWEGGKYAFDA